MQDVYSSKGTPQLEVFSVMMHKHSERPLNLYGSICIRSYVHECIYKRERDDSECLQSESKCFPLLLEGKPEIIPCSRGYVFDVDLKHRVEEGDESLDEELCKGVIDKRSSWGWHTMDTNELLNIRVDGKECSVEFAVGYYETAAKAHVTATVINLKMKDVVKVCGQITSMTSFILNASKDLFHKKFKDAIMVQPHDGSFVLQLPTSIVAAPLDSELTVSANLYARHDDKCVLLVSGTATFYVKSFGMSVGVISGIGCDIQVEIDWLYL